MSSTASSVKMLAMSWSKSVTISSATSAGRRARHATTAGKEAGGAATAGATVGVCGAAGAGAAASSAARAAAMMRSSRCSVACSMRPSNPPCDWKKPVDSSRCAATERMAFMQSAEQYEVRAVETDAAVESLAYPVFERRSEADAVPGFGHARAARQRVAGAIGLFADHVRRAAPTLGLHVTQHGVDVDLRLAAVDLAQLQVGARFFVRRRQHHVLAGRVGRLVEHPVQFDLRCLRRSPGRLRRRARVRASVRARSPRACRPGAYRACARALPSWPSALAGRSCSRPARGRDRRCPGRAPERTCRPRARSRVHRPSPRHRAPWPGSPASAAGCSRSPG